MKDVLDFVKASATNSCNKLLASSISNVVVSIDPCSSTSENSISSLVQEDIKHVDNSNCAKNLVFI